MPRYSIIIATYNRAEYVKKTIDSLLRQTLCDFEIIVCDDGSTDSTTKILENYGNKIRVVHTERKGPGGARNAGICVAAGEYISCLDSDDIWTPWTLECIDKIVCQREGQIAVYLRPVYYRDGQPVEALISRVPLAYRTFESYFDTPSRTACGATLIGAIPKNVFHEVGGFVEGLLNAEDRDLALRMASKLMFAIIDSPSTVLYREHPGQVTRNMERNVRSWTAVAERARRGDYGELRSHDRATAKVIQLLMEYAILILQLSGMWLQGIFFYREVLRIVWSCRKFMLWHRLNDDYYIRYPMILKTQRAWKKFSLYYPVILILTMVSRQAHKMANTLICGVRTAG